jgi:transcriptional regulator with GAF, ATPase, and Fis domain
VDADAEGVMSTVSQQRLAEVFVEITDTLVDDFDLIEFLHMVTLRTAELLDVSAAGLLLADPHGQLRFTAASDEATKLLELFQVQNHEGPCLDAFLTRTPVVNADLREATDHWPLFAPRATQSGFRSVHAIPLRLRSEVIGALNLFGADAGALEPDDVRTVQALADAATIGLLQERAIHRGDVLTEQLQAALNSRVVIEQAKGALSRIHGVGVDEAFELLRTHARRNHRRLSELAHTIITDPSSVPELTGD